MTIRTRHSRPETGSRGAVATANAAAVSAATEVLSVGGNAVDAAIAAQAVVCVTMPQAAGLGGDMLALIHADGATSAFTGTGKSPSDPASRYATDGGASVTVPGIVDAWVCATELRGNLPLAATLAPAIRIAEEGFFVDAALARAVEQQRARISAYGAAQWDLLRVEEDERWHQPQLARLLRAIVEGGRAAFYTGANAQAIASAIAQHGGTLSVTDLENHSTEVGDPVHTPWAGARLNVQPPPAQGALLALSASFMDSAIGVTPANLQHVLVEATEAAFAHRDRAGLGAALLSESLDIDLERAQNRGGPRAYLHTAGVAVADAGGMVVSSLVSVFDDFGSGVFVPELGIVLNNRAGGFTSGDNAPGPSKRPVHTLAPALLEFANGDVLALATPGADGQVQTLLQVLARMRFTELTLESAIVAPRWRSQDGSLLVESDHEALHDLAQRGHVTLERVAGDDLFGAVVAAGIAARRPYAASDWRRTVMTGTL